MTPATDARGIAISKLRRLRKAKPERRTTRHSSEGNRNDLQWECAQEYSALRDKETVPAFVPAHPELSQLIVVSTKGNNHWKNQNDAKYDLGAIVPSLHPQKFGAPIRCTPRSRLPQFYTYLLRYPNERPANVEDTFYWARVKFGLKPTLRIIQLTTMSGKPGDDLACAIAEKQLYSSHYFETALDLSFCVRGQEDVKQRGFYLITAMGSEQAGLTGPKGAIVRKAAVNRPFRIFSMR